MVTQNPIPNCPNQQETVLCGSCNWVVSKLERLTGLDTPDLYGYNLEFPKWDYCNSLPKQITALIHKSCLVCFFSSLNFRHSISLQQNVTTFFTMVEVSLF